VNRDQSRVQVVAQASRTRLEGIVDMKVIPESTIQASDFAGFVPASRGAHCHPLHPRLASLCFLGTKDVIDPRLGRRPGLGRSHLDRQRPPNAPATAAARSCPPLGRECAAGRGMGSLPVEFPDTGWKPVPHGGPRIAQVILVQLLSPVFTPMRRSSRGILSLRPAHIPRPVHSRRGRSPTSPPGLPVAAFPKRDNICRPNEPRTGEFFPVRASAIHASMAGMARHSWRSRISRAESGIDGSG
jgi:hypothetical protein